MKLARPLCSALIFTGIAGCASLPALPPVDLHQPDWTILEGQAVWRRDRHSPEIAGDILVATKTDGSAFVAFTKTPFTMVLAQRRPDVWQIESPSNKSRWTGRGEPPARLLWFKLPFVARGDAPARGWSVKSQSPQNWRLESDSNGESVEVWLPATAKIIEVPR